MAYPFPDSVLLIFCKAPIPGQVKTRLQPALNAAQAAEAHRQLTRMTLQRAFQRALCPVELHCAPDTHDDFFQDCVSRYPLVLKPQRGADLGERMQHAFADALSRYRHAVLMGCDCPSLSADDLHRALLKLLAGHDAVIAPADDGGYVMIGLNQAQPSLFSDMTWSHDQVMAATRRRAKDLGLKVYELDSQWGVDNYQDWQRYLELANS
ncbi:TIGR04282 family arsenosugar biosynthesis glycosyltransferase [Methylomonas sp. SURF-2]|uniref:TIGR04282 family arsenosugar biosynthesis glycosyltransferase n=1 Tax=Methylomonas subterranea TaxID=2952225 RepID=A0ABT1TEW6_9GAMM|nr:TIGR04282 family arsenosugar biosynthesis glycosyltransferase [Methylomonas sp. SURF-2]MCQ8104008.1 TIGR04282 family arsenosugar biosynthesis glycosyltransferase [Methylomonas sp. SURF-2]